MYKGVVSCAINAAIYCIAHESTPHNVLYNYTVYLMVLLLGYGGLRALRLDSVFSMWCDVIMSV